MRRRIALALCGAAMVVAGFVGAGERLVMEAILVRVNDRIVTVSDFGHRLAVELSQMPEPPTGQDLEGFARELFNSVVDELILLERAQERRIIVEESMVDSAIQSLREENDLVDDEVFEEALRSAGLSQSLLRDRYRQSILLQRVVQSEVQPTQITEEELRQRYEAEIETFSVPAKVELEQIFVAMASDGSDSAQVMSRTQGLVSRVRDGNDFAAEATLAGAELQELGAIPVADLRPELGAALEQLDEGQITDPLETGGGYQVIRLVRRIPAGYQTFDEVKETIRRYMSRAAYGDQTRSMVERLKEEYLVEVHEDRLEQLIVEFGNA